jgi:hypothetical protein
MSTKRLALVMRYAGWSEEWIPCLIEWRGPPQWRW